MSTSTEHDSDLNDSDLNDSDLNDSDLNDSDLNDSDLNDSDLNDSDLNDSDLNDSHLNDIAFNVSMGLVPVLAVAGAIVAVVAFGWSPLLVPWLPLVAVLALITVIDLRELRVPNRIVGPAALIAPALLGLGSLSDEATVSFTRSLLGGLAMFGIYFALAVISPAGMGMGDVKLSPLIGSALALISWQHWTRGLVWAFVSMAVISIVLIALRIANRKSALPFAPFMALGALIAIVV